MYICLDIGGTAIKVALSDELGNLTQKNKIEVVHDFEKLIESIISYINQFENLDGIAISAPGAVDTQRGIIYGASAVPCIHGPNWKEILKKRTGLNVSIENDANCAALAEVFNGNAADESDLLFIVCGSGIGGAIIKNKKIHKGSHLYGGEFGYMIMGEEDGQLYNFSDCASTMSFVRKARKYFHDDSIDGKTVFEKAKNGDQMCLELIDTFYYNLAKGIYSLQHIYDPSIILLGGAICESEDFISKLEDKIEMIANNIGLNCIIPVLKTCTHKSDANLIGALSHYLNEYE